MPNCNNVGDLRHGRVGKRALLCGAASLLAICSSTAASGQSAPGESSVAVVRPQAASPAASQPTPQTVGQGDALSDIVVTARKKAERLLDVPVAVTVAGPKEVARYAINSISNIKIVAPQITFDRGFAGSSGSISLRGVSSSPADAGLEQSTLIVVDGMPTSRGRIISDSVFDVANINVLKGPQSLFFGKNSPAGVVAITSNNPTDKWEGYVRTGYEFRADQANLEAAIGGPITPTFGVRLAVIANKSRGYITNDDVDGIVSPLRVARLPTDTGGTFDPSAGRRLGGDRNLGGRLTLRYDDNRFDATFKMLVSRYSSDGLFSLMEVMGCPGGATKPTTAGIVDPTGDCKLNDHVSEGLPPRAVLANWPNVAKYNNGNPYTRDMTYLPTLVMNYKLTDDININSTTGYYSYNFVNQGNSDATSYAFYYSENDEKFKSFTQELRMTSSFKSRLNFSAGLFYENDKRNFINGASNITAADPTTGEYQLYDLLAKNSAQAYSAFAQLNYKPIDTIEIAAGARYTYEHKHINMFDTFVNANVAASYLPVGSAIIGSHNEHNVSPEVTASWHPTHDILIYAAYKTGYLSGGFSNPGNIGRSLNAATDSYNAEKAKGFEGGVKYQLLNRHLTGSLVGYRYTFKGLQLTSFDASFNPPLIRTQNAANSVSQGIEFETQYDILTNFSIRGSINYNDAHYISFPNAQCYVGEGCSLQDLSGRPLYRAPHWIETAGVVYDIPFANDSRLSLNADIRATSGYYVSLNLNPLGYQSAFTIVNAGARYSLPNDRWSVALIGRNLSNVRYGTLGVDKVGGKGEVTTVAGEPRAVLLQLETRF